MVGGLGVVSAGRDERSSDSGVLVLLNLDDADDEPEGGGDADVFTLGSSILGTRTAKTRRSTVEAC